MRRRISRYFFKRPTRKSGPVRPPVDREFDFTNIVIFISIMIAIVLALAYTYYYLLS